MENSRWQRGLGEILGHFRQIPSAEGERAIAVSRLFRGGARRLDPGDPLAYPHPQRPIARYAARLSIGMPCWVPGSACRKGLGR